jgi:hypothetical protein
MLVFSFCHGCSLPGPCSFTFDRLGPLSRADHSVLDTVVLQKTNNTNRLPCVYRHAVRLSCRWHLMYVCYAERRPVSTLALHTLALSVCVSLTVFETVAFSWFTMLLLILITLKYKSGYQLWAFHLVPYSYWLIDCFVLLVLDSSLQGLVYVLQLNCRIHFASDAKRLCHPAKNYYIWIAFLVVTIFYVRCCGDVISPESQLCFE